MRLIGAVLLIAAAAGFGMIRASQLRQRPVPLPTLPQADSVPVREESVLEPPISETEYGEPLEEAAASPPEPEISQEPRPDTGGARLPSEEMQRLMNSAGHSLRAIDREQR